MMTTYFCGTDSQRKAWEYAFSRKAYGYKRCSLERDSQGLWSVTVY